MMIDARKQFEKEPKSFGNKRNRMTDTHRAWIKDAIARLEERLRRRAGQDLPHGRTSPTTRSVLSSGSSTNTTSRQSSPSPTRKSFTAANLKKEQAVLRQRPDIPGAPEDRRERRRPWNSYSSPKDNAAKS